MPETRSATAHTFEDEVGTQFRTIDKRLELQDKKLGKIDKRFDSLEGNLGNQFSSQEMKFDQKLAKLEELVRSMANQREQDHSRTFNKTSLQSPSGSGAFRNNHGVTRLAKINFPRFNGDKLKEWLIKVEEFFEIDNTPDDVKVNMASMYMEDVAAHWHQSLVTSEYGYLVLKDWQTYRDVLVERFEDLWEDPVSEQKNLRKTDEQCDVIDEMIQSVQSWCAETKAMFQSWREENLIERQKKEDEFSRMEMDAKEVPNTASASDLLDLSVVAIKSSSDLPATYIVLEDDSNLDSRTEVFPHQITKDSTLDSSSDELIKEPVLLATSFLAPSLFVEKDYTVFQVSISQLEPSLHIHSLSVGVGEVRQEELGLDGSCGRNFESFQVLSVWIV